MRPVEVLRLERVDDQTGEWVAFVEGLGVDPKRACNHLLIMQDEDGYHLHLSIKTPGPSGKGDWIDLASQNVVTTPLVIDLGHERTWPEIPPAARPKDFSKALVDCRLGMKISHTGWNATGQFVVFQRGYPNGIAINANTADATGIPEGTICVFRPYLMLRTADGSFVPWAPSVSDVLAMDWITVE